MRTGLLRSVICGCLLTILIVSPAAIVHADGDQEEVPSAEISEAAISVGDAIDLGDGFIDITEPELDDL